MTFDLVLVGGGLANCLIAYRLNQQRPDLEIAIVERGDRLGGNHVWSFHESDLTAAQHRWMAPLVVHSWTGHEVRFPSYRRHLAGSYHSLTSESLAGAVERSRSLEVRLGTEVDRLSPGQVHLSDGSTIEGNLVIDGRGATGVEDFGLAYQKFLGWRVELETPIDLDHPILMDATVEQLDGYRFIYTLPFSPTSLLIEDTRYSDSDHLDCDDMRAGLSRYLDRQGWKLREVVTEEQGVLPVILSGDIDAYWRRRIVGVPSTGMLAMLFHPTTGYSLLEAVALADRIAELPGALLGEELDALIRRRSADLWHRGRYFRLLNRMLFEAAEPDLRYRVFEHFYRLREPLIERFYAARPTVFDRIRILMGRPPVPVNRALRCFVEPTAPVRASPSFPSPGSTP